jgi:hypothetical protein
LSTSDPDQDEDEDEDEDQVHIHLHNHIHIHIHIQIQIRIRIRIEIQDQDGHRVVVIENSSVHKKALNFIDSLDSGRAIGVVQTFSVAPSLHRCIASSLHRSITPPSSLLAHHAGDSHRQRDPGPVRNAESKSNDGAGEEVQMPVLQSSVQPQRASKSARKIA